MQHRNVLDDHVATKDPISCRSSFPRFYVSLLKLHATPAVKSKLLQQMHGTSSKSFRSHSCAVFGEMCSSPYPPVQSSICMYLYVFVSNLYRYGSDVWLAEFWAGSAISDNEIRKCQRSEMLRCLPLMPWRPADSFPQIELGLGQQSSVSRRSRTFCRLLWNICEERPYLTQNEDVLMKSVLLS